MRTLFPKIRALSSNFQESAGETSPSPLSSYAPIVIRKYRIPFFTKFAIVKLKIDLFRVSLKVLCVGRYRLPVSISLHSPP